MDLAYSSVLTYFILVLAIVRDLESLHIVGYLALALVYLVKFLLSLHKVQE